MSTDHLPAASLSETLDELERIYANTRVSWVQRRVVTPVRNVFTFLRFGKPECFKWSGRDKRNLRSGATPPGPP